MNLSTIAQHLDVHPSNASRTCDQLVACGKAVREAHDLDRRSTMLRLTADGTRFVANLMTARQRLIDAVICRMSPDDQHLLTRGLEAFMAAVAATPPEESAGLPDGRIIPWLL
jgi:DNA-binding MarR family transcriptional regulator